MHRHTNMYTCMFIPSNTCICTCTYTLTYTYTYIIHIHIYIDIDLYVKSVFIHIYTYIYIYIHIYVYMYLRIHIHTGGGLTRIAVRKYTFFGVHPTGKHLGNGAGMLPNISCLRVYRSRKQSGPTPAKQSASSTLAP